MQLDALDRWLAGFDLTVPYLIVCWAAACCVVLNMQKIARREVMTRVRPEMGMIIRFILAILAGILLWSGYAPLRYAIPPWPSDLALVSSLALLLFVHAAAGCNWARLPPKS